MPDSDLQTRFHAWIAEQCLDLGFPLYGMTTAEPPERTQMLRQWVSQGAHEPLQWFADTADQRTDIRKLIPDARSVLVFGIPYDHVADANKDAVVHTISRYARGRDYHTVLRKRMIKLAKRLRSEWNCTVTTPSIDASPVAEKPYAEAAGLGWIGKSSNLINREYGSYFFITTMAIDLEFESHWPVSQRNHIEDACGQCTACIESCPTDAIKDGYVVTEDCLSFLTIERPRDPAYLQSKPKLPSASWLHGCDDCQEICPWVQQARRRIGSPGDPAFRPHDRWSEHTMQDLAKADDALLSEWLFASPLARQKVQGLRQNAQDLWEQKQSD